MSRKNLNFKPAVFKIFIFYVVIYLFALFLRYSSGFENLIIDIEYRYLALINIISIFFGLPISILLDFILIIRTFPILPFILGSYCIASSEINNKLIVLYSLVGSYFYYFSLFFIIQSV